MTSLGRSSENDVVMDDSSVSRRHAEIEIAGPRMTIRDAGSRNGIKVGGQKIEQPVELGHEGRVKIGIFELRLLTGPAGPATPSPPQQTPDAGAAEFPEPGGGVENFNEPLSESPLGESPFSESPLPRESLSPKKKKWIIYLLLLLLIGGGSFAIYQYLLPKIIPPLPELVQKGEGGPVEEGKMGQAPATGARTEATVPIFLDFTSTPLPAEVFFGDQSVGMTPLRLQQTLQTSRIYEVRAVYRLAEMGETLEAKLQFSPPPGVQVLTIPFVGRVGLFKIASLPRDVALYLEGYYEGDPFKARPVKFSDIVFGKPIYIPYGKYVMDVRRNRQLGVSQTFLDEVVYRREFVISPEASNYTVSIADADLTLFPVEIASVPSGAEVYFDDKKVGETPYQGSFPVGEHAMVLKKEGYFDYAQMVKMPVNTPYAAEVKLQTSAAGEMINLAGDKIREGRYQEAQDALVEGLKRAPAPREIAQINYLLGLTFFRTNQYPEAVGYFNQAIGHDDFKYRARLGIANVALAQGERIQALQLFIDVFMASEDPAVRSEAARLFQQISPLKSVLFIASDPPGAKVLANTTEVAQPAPVILHDLGVGTYRITIRKEGYLPEEIKINLGVSEFKPVIAKLKPVK